jgi:hypothetical protein
MNKIKKCCLILFAGCITHTQCWAIEEKILYGVSPQEGGGNKAIKVEEIEVEQESKIDFIEYSHDLLKEYIDTLSYNVDGFFIDTFFGDNILDDDVSGSRAKFSFSTRRVLGQPVDYKYGLSIKIVLPNTNDRFNLLLQSSDEDEDGRESNAIDTLENVEYSTALRYIFKETDRWKVNFDTGVKWGFPPDPFTRLRMRRYAYFDNYKARTTQTVFWSASDGFGERTSFELSRPLNIDRLMRFNAEAKYLLNNDYFELNYGLALYHELNAKEALGYYFRASGNTITDTTFNNYGIGLRYRRKVYKDWMFAEVSPELETTNSNEYDVTPVLMFRFEALIGNQ